MPRKETLSRLQRDRREGKAASTQAGEFIREEIHDIREGKHGARLPQQAIAIGLSKARRAGVRLRPPRAGTASASTRRKAERDYERGQGEGSPRRPSAKRAAASERALKREPHAAASAISLATHARAATTRRSKADRSASAKRPAQTKGPNRLSAAAEGAARTRAEHARA
jgi:hypothetical protein